MFIDYTRLREISGPLLVLDGVESAGYEEMVEIRMQDGSLKLLCNIYDMEAKKVAADEITEFPENYYERLQQCVEDCGLQKIHTGQLAIALPHTAAGYYEVYIDYASGRQIYAYSDDPAEVCAFLPMRDALMAFFGEIFHLS